MFVYFIYTHQASFPARQAPVSRTGEGCSDKALARAREKHGHTDTSTRKVDRSSQTAVCGPFLFGAATAPRPRGGELGGD